MTDMPSSKSRESHESSSALCGAGDCLEALKPQMLRSSYEEQEPDVEVFPAAPGYHLENETDPNDLAAKDSLKLKEIEDGEPVAAAVSAEKSRSDDGEVTASWQDRGTRRALWLFLLGFVLLAVVLGTVFGRSNRNKNVEPRVVTGAVLEDNVAPSPAPTSILEDTDEYQVLKPYVNPPSKLLDPDTPQGKAFQQIISESFDVDTDFRVKQRFAMMVTYYSMGGEAWTWQNGWRGFAEDECDWHGVQICRFRDNRRVIAGLQLRSNNASGTMPEELCMLESLETVIVFDNQLQGELPPCLTDLDSVFAVDVHGNQFSGRPPSGFLKMPNLQRLDLSSNQFTGGLDFLEGPTDRSDESPTSQSKLRSLRLDNNGFDGDVPPAVLSLDSLEELKLENTNVTGDITALCSNPSVSVLSVNCDRTSCNGDCCTCV